MFLLASKEKFVFDYVLEVRGYSWKVTIFESLALIDYPEDYPMIPHRDPVAEYLIPPSPEKFSSQWGFFDRMRWESRERDRKQRLIRAHIARVLMKDLNEIILEERRRGSKAKAPHRRRCHRAVRGRCP